MNKVIIEIMDDAERCKKWGYDETIIVISNHERSSIIASSALCLKELKRVLRDFEELE